MSATQAQGPEFGYPATAQSLAQATSNNLIWSQAQAGPRSLLANHPSQTNELQVQ